MLHTIPRTLCFITLSWIATLSACGTDDGNGSSPTSNADGGSGSSGGSQAPDAITESVLAACPQATTLIETTEWPSCLAGKRVTGTEPFTNTPCELRIGTNGAFEYVRSGTVALSIPERSGWGDANGTYQNERPPNGRLFLAGLSPSLPAVEGKPRVDNITLNFFELASQDDTIEVRYLDEKLARQTYNCKVDVL